MVITNTQTNDSYEALDIVVDGDLVHIYTSIDKKLFVITVPLEEYKTIWQ